MNTDLIQIYPKVKKSLIKHEGLKLFPYVDTVGKVTMGIGYNLTDRGMTKEWAVDQFDKDVSYFYSVLSTHLWFQKLNDDRKTVILDMSFMGLKKLLGFTKMIAAIKENNYELASKEMLQSKWAQQVGQRAIDLANGMVTGVYDV